MTEKKEDWKAEIAEIFRKEIKEIKETALKQAKENVPLGALEEPHHVFDPDCPTCKPKIDAYVNPLLEKARENVVKIFKERVNLPYECAGDGCGVEKEETECPICHGKKARRR